MSQKNEFPAKLKSGQFVITTEIVPPVSVSADDLLSKAEALKGLVDAVNVTDGASAKVHMSSLASAALLKRQGLEPIMQMTCRDRNKIAILSDLLGAGALDVSNFLFMHGDDPSVGPYPETTAVFEAESLDLMAWAHGISEEGVLPKSLQKEEAPGSLVQTKPSFFIGCADAPHIPEKDWEPVGLRKKIEAGAQFSQTQLCYDIELVRQYFARLQDLGITESLYYLLGTGPLASSKQARWMNKNLFGVTVPDAIIERLDAADDQRQEGVLICNEFLQAVKEIKAIQGVHLMAPGNGEAVVEVIQSLA